jgi:hypothetical protein
LPVRGFDKPKPDVSIETPITANFRASLNVLGISIQHRRTERFTADAAHERNANSVPDHNFG